MHLIIAGIHTGIGKTICAAVLTEALGFDYWKPVQAGEPTDCDFVRTYTRNPSITIHKEAYRLATAASPHYAAALEDISIELSALQPPQTVNDLVIETAGGLMSPLGPSLLNLDAIKKWNSPVVLVCGDYLGSINHSLGSIALLQGAGVSICGLVFSGAAVASTRAYIAGYSGVPLLLSIPQFDVLSASALCAFAAEASEDLKQRLHEFCTKR
jgi:dethiobiotin synthetase